MTRYDAYVQKNWEEAGLAQVLVSRTREDGSADLGFFLVDVFCLGVKDAFLRANLSETERSEFFEERLPADFRERFHPACAKKLIEGALAYAESLGFAPHRDFKKARKVLSGIDPSVCPREFTFGRDGRPCYVRGDVDPEARVERICAILEARCGAGGFDYEDPDEAADDEALREDLMDWLEAEPPAVPRFYEVSGLLTGMLLCPGSPAPTRVADVLWPPPGRVWRDQREAQEFLGLLMGYWNIVNNLILDAIDPGAPPELHPVDVSVEDFPEEDDLPLAAAMFDWASGFLRSTILWPELWADALTRPDLAPHWEVIGWWSRFEDQVCRDKIVAAIEGPTPRTLTSAVAALARALRHPLVP